MVKTREYACVITTVKKSELHGVLATSPKQAERVLKSGEMPGLSLHSTEEELETDIQKAKCRAEPWNL